MEDEAITVVLSARGCKQYCTLRLQELRVVKRLGKGFAKWAMWTLGIYF